MSIKMIAPIRTALVERFFGAAGSVKLAFVPLTLFGLTPFALTAGVAPIDFFSAIKSSSWENGFWIISNTRRVSAREAIPLKSYPDIRMIGGLFPLGGSLFRPSDPGPF